MKVNILLHSCLGILILPSLFGSLGTDSSYNKDGNNPEQNFTPTHQPVVVYMEKDHGKTNLMRSSGYNRADKIGTFEGKPKGYTMSPDRNNVALYDDKKLSSYNLNSRENYSDFKPQKQICGANYSPDSSRLIVWDQNCRRGRQSDYYIHQYNPGNKQDNITYHGQNLPTKNYFSPYAWRSDNKLILLEIKSSAKVVWLYDLSTNVMSPTNFQNPVWISPDGRYMAMTNKNSYLGNLLGSQSVYDPYSWHDDMNSRPMKNGYNIIDPLSGNAYANFGDNNRYNSIVGYSPYQNEIMYQSSDHYSSSAGQYYTSNIGGGSPQPISNPYSELQDWNYGNIGAEVNRQGGTYIIIIAGQVIITTNNRPGLISQYYGEQNYSPVTPTNKYNPSQYPRHNYNYVGRTRYIVMINGRYSPAIINARVGDRVVWTNKDKEDHTATSPEYGFSSGLMAPGQTYSVDLQKPGDFYYYCQLHPDMQGRIRVRDVATTPNKPGSIFGF